MEEAMKTRKLPRTDSIQKLARFWDTHDLTDFEEELEEVTEPVFAESAPIRVRLQANEADAVREIAAAKGVSKEELVREWIVQKLARHKSNGPHRRRS